MNKMFFLFIAMLIAGISMDASGQVKVDLKKKLENAVNRRANQKTDKAIEKGLDKVEEGIKGDTQKEDAAKEAEKKNQADPNSAAGPAPAGEAATVQNPTLEAYSKYDFVPGEKVIFFEDFSQDAVGDFPALWNTNGSAEVVTTNLFPGNWMRYIMDQCVWTDPVLDLPDNYTIEFDVVPIPGENNTMRGWQMRLYQAKNLKAWDGGSAPGNGGFKFTIEYSGRPGYSTWLYGDCSQQNLSGFKEGVEFKQKVNQKYHVAIWVQKTRLRIYQNQDKIFDLPRAFPTGCVKPNRIRFENGAAMISNLRVAIGAPDMRNKLMAEGKLVTYGIYFDVNKDIVKPESYGTLKEIATILNEVPDVKVKIFGHTDSDGVEAANLDLSKRRAAAVKNELAKSFGVNAERLETDGLGESQPVAPNDSPANKALNRRVEFVKL